MKGSFYLFFGLLLGTGAASGQVTGFLRRPDTALELVAMTGGKFRAMAPDRMPCVVPDPARLERMPTLRSANKDRMPNGFQLGRPQPFYIRPGQPLYIKPGEK
jgi:hypothetical protein